MSDALFQPGMKYEVFIGLKDKDTYEEVFDVDMFKKALSEICEEEQICFSLLTQLGGYTHNKGYTTETSLRVIVIGPGEDEIVLLGERLKQLINTDTILITKTEIECCFM